MGMQKKIKKAVFLTIDFPPMGGGMARLSESIASALKEIGYEVIVVAPSADETAAYDKRAAVHVHRVKGIDCGHIFDNYPKSVIYFFARALRVSFWRRPGMVVANTWSIAGVAAFLIKKLTGTPYMIFANGLDVYAPQASPKTLWLMKLVLRNASVVAAISDFTTALVLKAERRANVVVVNPCVDTMRFAAGPGTVPDLQNGRRKILTVARLVGSKGHDTVLKALTSVVRRFPDLEYFIVGDGPEREYLERLTGELGLSQCVIFTGEVDEAALISYYRACDLFVLTSMEIEASGECEGFGIVFLEAGACAKAVIGSRSGGIPEAVIDGVTGLLVEESDINATAEAIIKLLSDDGFRRALGENGKMRVDREMNAAAFAEKIGRVLTCSKSCLKN